MDKCEICNKKSLISEFEKENNEVSKEQLDLIYDDFHILKMIYCRKHYQEWLGIYEKLKEENIKKEVDGISENIRDILLHEIRMIAIDTMSEKKKTPKLKVSKDKFKCRFCREEIKGNPLVIIKMKTHSGYREEYFCKKLCAIRELEKSKPYILKKEKEVKK